MIRAPWGMSLVAISPLPFPGTSSIVYMGKLEVVPIVLATSSLMDVLFNHSTLVLSCRIKQDQQKSKESRRGRSWCLGSYGQFGEEHILSGKIGCARSTQRYTG